MLAAAHTVEQEEIGELRIARPWDAALEDLPLVRADTAQKRDYRRQEQNARVVATNSAQTKAKGRFPATSCGLLVTCALEPGLCFSYWNVTDQASYALFPAHIAHASAVGCAPHSRITWKHLVEKAGGRHCNNRL